MMEFVLVNKDRVRTSKDKFNINSFDDKFTGNVGALIPEDCIVIDIDSTSPKSIHYMRWLKSMYPDIFITKTAKAGGYHAWFKTDEIIKRNTGNLTSIFGWKFDILTGVNNYVTLPDNFDNRKYMTKFNSMRELAEGWDAYNVRITESDIQKIMPYVYKDNEHKTPIELDAGGRNSGLLEWLGFCASQGIHPDDVKPFSLVLSQITGLAENEINSTILASLTKYSKRDNNPEEQEQIPNFYGDALPELQQQLVSYINDNKLFGYDAATGIYCCNVDDYNGKILSQQQFIDLMHLHFAKRLYYVNRDKNGIKKSTTELSVSDRTTLFKTITPYISFNSRKLMYDNIEPWDGVERINSFMKDYFECDANPNFTWLLLTSIVGMLKDPENCYCPYFFDFVGNKAVGKTLLPTRLVGDQWAFMQWGRSYDDLFVNIYNANSLIAIDDECVITSGGTGFNKMNYDQFKQFVTAKTDRFSRKNAQPETHTRNFIVVRTSNDTKTGYATDERRQIIFESNLPRNECRIKPDDLPDSFFRQLLAEAKMYYEKKGRYVLDNEDWECVNQQQIDSFDTENPNYMEIEGYVNWCITKIKSGVQDSEDCFVRDGRVSTGIFISWNTYHEYCKKVMSKPIGSRIFWNELHAIQAKTGKILFDTKKKIKYNGTSIRFAEIVLTEPVVDNTPAEFKTKTISVREYMPKELPAEPQVKRSEIADELNAVRKNFADTNKYNVSELIEYCPKAVKDFFNKYKDAADQSVPTAIDVNGFSITYGIGGLHGAVGNYKGNDLVYLDVKSMYPNIMLNWDLLSRAVENKDIYAGWVDERLKLKAQGKIEESDALKLKINSVYGLMKAKWCNLYDPYNASSVAVMGQILLTILIVKLQEQGCQIINANTDGLIIKAEGDWESACNLWELMTALKLSRENIERLEQADVNNYRAYYPGGRVVNKGAKFKE